MEAYATSANRTKVGAVGPPGCVDIEFSLHFLRAELLIKEFGIPLRFSASSLILGDGTVASSANDFPKGYVQSTLRQPSVAGRIYNFDIPDVVRVYVIHGSKMGYSKVQELQQ